MLRRLTCPETVQNSGRPRPRRRDDFGCPRRRGLCAFHVFVVACPVPAREVERLNHEADRLYGPPTTTATAPAGKAATTRTYRPHAPTARSKETALTDATPTTITVTLDLTEDDARTILVTAFHEAARTADDNALRAGDSSDPDTEWAESQERRARTTRALAETVEGQLQAHRSTPDGQA